MTPTRGFTLIELLITIAIAAIAMSIAVPSMITFQRNAELTSAANNLANAINVARSEAMKRNMHVYVTPIGATGWNAGYRVYVDMDATDTGYNSDKDVLITEQDAAKGTNLATLELTGAGTAADSNPYLHFDGSGYLRTNDAGFATAALTIKRRDTKGTADEKKETRSVMVARTGRVRTCRPYPPADEANCDPANP